MHVGAAADERRVARWLYCRRTHAALPSQAPSAVPGAASCDKKHRKRRLLGSYR